MLSACMHRPVYPTIYIDAACLKEPIELTECDGMSPPHCRKAKVVFTKGCERVSAK